MKRTTLAAALATPLVLCGCQTSPTERAQAAGMALDRVYAELNGVQQTLDQADLNHFVYSTNGVCLDPDRALLRQLSAETRDALDVACERLLNELPDVHPVRRGR